MKLRLLVTTLCCLLLFSGCVPLESNVENLLQPPKLTDLQSQVDKALREAVGRDFILKYPKSGQHRSAFNFIDMDEDGVDEAVAFYTLANDNIQIALLRQQPGGDWMVTDIMSGLPFCTEVDFVNMLQIGDSKRLWIGWGGTGLDNNLLTVYDYHRTSPQSQDQPVRWDYSQLLVTDMDKNGRNELLLMIAPESFSEAPPLAQLVGENNEGIIDLLAEVELPRNITAYRTPVVGGVGNNQYGVAADCVLNNGNLCTLTLTYDGNQLMLPLNELSDTNLFRQTVRTQQVLSCDINNDGMVDVPVERPATGYAANSTDAVYLIDYSNHRSNQLVPVQTAYVNLTRGFRFLFPDRWQEQPIGVQVQPDHSEVVLFLNSTGNLYDHSQELLRFQIYSTLDGIDSMAEGRYFQLGTKGTYVYRAMLPTQPLEELALTQDEVMGLFSLVS